MQIAALISATYKRVELKSSASVSICEFAYSLASIPVHLNSRHLITKSGVKLTIIGLRFRKPQAWILPPAIFVLVDHHPCRHAYSSSCLPTYLPKVCGCSSSFGRGPIVWP